MIDETETIRRNLVAEINLLPGSREALEAQHGKVYDTSELQEEFQALGFMFETLECRLMKSSRRSVPSRRSIEKQRQEVVQFLRKRAGALQKKNSTIFSPTLPVPDQGRPLGIDYVDHLFVSELLLKNTPGG